MEVKNIKALAKYVIERLIFQRIMCLSWPFTQYPHPGLKDAFRSKDVIIWNRDLNKEHKNYPQIIVSNNFTNYDTERDIKNLNLQS